MYYYFVLFGKNIGINGKNFTNYHAALKINKAAWYQTALDIFCMVNKLFSFCKLQVNFYIHIFCNAHTRGIVVYVIIKSVQV